MQGPHELGNLGGSILSIKIFNNDKNNKRLGWITQLGRVETRRVCVCDGTWEYLACTNIVLVTIGDIRHLDYVRPTHLYIRTYDLYIRG